ncbi:hypothetical protein IGI04_015053 [Brassica rapa subsp. trilocularis]|uniref:Uncharacterized protein n=1 Tax=Brassica rapa subsp. trilocularis TaxID=1813537 RepID=A0ABQ7MS01_BRACM|nr:hypothetical protein IGI04_015053 [Brassica rapa subsp. trilocularis]
MFATDCATYGWFWRRCKRLSVIHSGTPYMRCTCVQQEYMCTCVLCIMLIWFAVKVCIDFALVYRVSMFAADCVTYGRV